MTAPPAKAAGTLRVAGDGRVVAGMMTPGVMYQRPYRPVPRERYRPLRRAYRHSGTHRSAESLFGVLLSGRTLPSKRLDVRHLIPFAFLVLATTLEASGDAIIRVGLRPHPILARIALMLAGTVILYGYGLTLNLAPLDWGRLIGAYVATFFVVGQIINLVAFGTAPTLPIVVGGLFILTGGAIITLWHR
jgi:hypothetical protein